MSSEAQNSPPNDIAISVRNLTKTYRLFDHPGDRVKQFISFGVKHYHREFTGLKDVSFDIKKGETVGIIGRNGSGKSTLLQLICGILKPTLGTVQINGRISALLELGAGFNPEFTGRENVYFHGALTGFTQKQMEQRFGDIAAFADIGEFIDQPVRTYSSGMFVRLAFAVAVHSDPDILVVDEALGVGDAGFQERSITRMNEMRLNGTTILLVSHSLPAIRNFCQRALWLDRGVIKLQGTAGETCLAYQTQTIRSVSTIGTPEKSAATQGLHPVRQKRISIVDFTVNKTYIAVGEELSFSVTLNFSDANTIENGFGVGIIVKNESGRIVAIFNTTRDDVALTSPLSMVLLQLPRATFIPGRYFASINVCDKQALFAYDELESSLTFEVHHEFNQYGIPRWEGEVACEHAWHW